MSDGKSADSPPFDIAHGSIFAHPSTLARDSPFDFAQDADRKSKRGRQSKGHPEQFRRGGMSVSNGSIPRLTKQVKTIIDISIILE